MRCARLCTFLMSKLSRKLLLPNKTFQKDSIANRDGIRSPTCFIIA